MQAYFDRLGATLEKAWTAASREEESFPDIAAEALAADPPSRAFDKEAFVRERLDTTRPMRRQLSPLGSFGQPSFTVFHGDGFAIDVYFWVSSESAIHNHPFCGAFTVLDGFSVHAVYAFDEHERLGPRLRTGELRQTRLSLVEPGHVEAFSLERHPLVHALLHVPVGTVSMVVRTARTVGYLRYLPPSLALAMDAPDENVGRRLALLETLRQARDPRFSSYLHEFLSRSDFEASFLALSRLWPDAEPPTRRALLDEVRERHGDVADLLPPVMERVGRWFAANTLREGLFDPDDRFIATALMLAESRRGALSLLEARLGAGHGAGHEAGPYEPVARLHRFVDEVLRFDDDDPAAPVLAHALVDGLDTDGAEARLAEAFGAENVVGQREVIDAHQRASVFSALAR